MHVQELSLCLAFDYADHDMYEIIRYHRDLGAPIPLYTIKSLMHQLLQGVWMGGGVGWGGWGWGGACRRSAAGACANAAAFLPHKPTTCASGSPFRCPAAHCALGRAVFRRGLFP